jgi:beta-lactamase superfamily II metal-dependent hydrolase
MLPAFQGDSLWLEYGDPRRARCILIDGGPRSRIARERLLELIAERAMVGGEVKLELVVVTHIDADHIAGVLDLLENRDVSLTTGDVWFNGWQHLPTDQLGAKQGEALSTAIRQRRLPWNVAYSEAAVFVPDDGPLPTVELVDGMTLTILSPTRADLAALRPVWKKEVEKAGLVPGIGASEPPEQPDVLGERPLDPEELAAEPFEEDDSKANGSSIALLAEYAGKSVLLTGDAHPSVLARNLGRLAAERGLDRIPIDALKLSHHGGKHNLSRELLDRLECGRYLFSTNGNIFHHPDAESVSRVIVDRNDYELVFNYRSPETERWDSSRLRRRFRYRTTYPETDREGIRVEL